MYELFFQKNQSKSSRIESQLLQLFPLIETHNGKQQAELSKNVLLKIIADKQ